MPPMRNRVRGDARHRSGVDCSNAGVRARFRDRRARPLTRSPCTGILCVTLRARPGRRESPTAWWRSDRRHRRAALYCALQLLRRRPCIRPDFSHKALGRQLPQGATFLEAASAWEERGRILRAVCEIELLEQPPLHPAQAFGHFETFIPVIFWTDKSLTRQRDRSALQRRAATQDRSSEQTQRGCLKYWGEVPALRSPSAYDIESWVSALPQIASSLLPTVGKANHDQFIGFR